MMGCCSLIGLFFGMTIMASPLIVAGLIFYLLTRRPEGSQISKDY